VTVAQVAAVDVASALPIDTTADYFNARTRLSLGEPMMAALFDLALCSCFFGFAQGTTGGEDDLVVTFGKCA
jgi:hypothetical protein